jgi:ATP-dependent helicase/nuclease subunit A
MAPPDNASDAAADADARTAVRTDLTETLFVEAGAGSGKTKCLVERFVALVQAGVPADRIAAITFTEKAASELADRVRQALERAGDHASLALLDRAAIGTLHAFAQRILNEHAIEAGLPPRLEVLDEISSQLAFEERWDAFVDRLLEDPPIEAPLRVLLACDIDMRHLRDIALAFGDNWDLVAERSTDARQPMAPLDAHELLAALDEVVAAGDACTHEDDRLLARIAELAAWGADFRDATDDDARVALLGDRPSTRVGNLGRVANWPSIADARAAVAKFGDRCSSARSRVLHDAIVHVADAIARFTVDAADERRQAGQLEFHDLLVLARAVLRSPAHGHEVRAAVRDRYQRLLLDEFQDTDPIQVELATLLASDPASAPVPWPEAAVEPGRLFFVGDPKQSIYRFRRADISVFLAARDRLAGRVHRLSRNFRTTAPIVDWVNHTFGRLVVAESGSQPAYERLDAARSAGAPHGPSVTLVGGSPLPATTTADGLRAPEAVAVAAIARRAVTEGWSVSDGDRDGGWRPARWSDVAILLPARTSLRMLERALEDADVPYRAETSSLVYGTREVRDLLTVARAVEDPTDSLAVVAALRTPAFGCGDDDLYTWRVHHRGWWDHQRPLPDGAPVDHPVAVALAWLGALHRDRRWLSPSAVLDRIVVERRLLEVAIVHPRPRDVWRRLRFVVDQARAWGEAGGVTLRQYLAWVRLQSAPGSRVVETVLPESDDDAVRILTVHGAKGLEFPITILSGLTTLLRARPAGVQVRFPAAGGWALKLGRDVHTEEFEAGEAVEEQMDRHERLRLLYVAATRARDHLVVSVHRKEARPNGTVADTAAQVLWDAGHDGPGVVVDPAAGSVVVGAAAVLDTADALPPLVARDEWESARTSALARASLPQAISATALARSVSVAEDDPGLAKDGRDVDLPPWQKGRYGTAIGRAVHGVLQTIDLATGADLDAAVAAQSAAEGTLGREHVVAALVRSALASDVVRRAAVRDHWRELYVGCPVGDTVLEGFVDLLYRDDDGLVIIDHKTDAWHDAADLDAKVDHYRIQLAAYAHAVTQAVAEPVVRALLLFLAPDGATVHEVDLSAVDVLSLSRTALASGALS